MVKNHTPKVDRKQGPGSQAKEHSGVRRPLLFPKKQHFLTVTHDIQAGPF